MYFSTKSYVKNNRNNTAKQTLRKKQRGMIWL
jgi:hypothetical protein